MTKKHTFISFVFIVLLAFVSILYFRGKMHVNDLWTLIIGLIVLYFAVLKTLKHLPKKQLADKSFLIIFFILLVLPMSFIEKEDIHISAKENRVLAPFKSPIQDNKLNENFGKDFDAWFNDRFFGREKVIKRYHDVRNMLMFKKGNRHALIGKDGWLYTKRFNSVEMYRNANLFSDSELQAIGHNLQTFMEKAHQHGVKQVYFVFSHDKESLYSEFYPDGFFKMNTISRLEQLENFLSTNYPQVPFLDFSDKMKQLKDQGQVIFCKTGTHMNNMGSYYEYYFLMKQLAKGFQTIRPMELDRFTIKEEYKCDIDIYNSLDLKDYDKENLKNKTLTLNNSTAQALEKITRTDEKYGFIETFKNHPKLPTAVMIGDSFSDRYHNYLAENFSSFYYVYTAAGRNFVWFDSEKKYITQNVPDIFVVETTERFLHRLLTLEYPEI